MRAPFFKLLMSSFVPVLVVAVAFIAVALFVEYRSFTEASKVTVIEISEVTNAGEGEDASGAELVAVEKDTDGFFSSANALLAAKDLSGAEREYKRLLKQRRTSAALNNLGVVYLRQGKNDNAASALTEAVELTPVYAHAYLNRGLAFSRLGKSAEAIKDYRKFNSLVPGHFDGRMNLGIALRKNKDYASAVEAFLDASKLAGGDRKASALYWYGVTLLDESKVANAGKAVEAFKAAIRLRPDSIEPRIEVALLEGGTDKAGIKRVKGAFDKIFELKPNFAPSYFRYGLFLSSVGDRDGAIENYRKALLYDGDYFAARYNLGITLLASDKWQEAGKEFEWLVKRDPSHAESRFNLGRVAFKEGDIKRAVTEYEAALRLRSGNYPEALLNLGLVRSSAKDYSGAEKNYLKALSLRPDYPEAYFNLGLARFRSMKYDTAEEAFRSAIKADPRYEQAYFNLGILYSRKNDTQKAIDAYKNALRIRPDYAQAGLNLGVLLARSNRYMEAVDTYKKLVETDGTYASAWFNLGLAYTALADYNEAVNAFERTLALEPGNIKAMVRLATALEAKKDYDGAVRAYRRAVEADPSDANIRASLAVVLKAKGMDAEARVEADKALKLAPGNSTLQDRLKNILRVGN